MMNLQTVARFVQLLMYLTIENVSVDENLLPYLAAAERTLVRV